MNLLLRGIGGEFEEDLPAVTKDALAGKHDEYEIVLANPPFGKKSIVTIVNEAGKSSKEPLIINRDELPLRRLCREASGFGGDRCRAVQSGQARATSSSIFSSTSSPSSNSTVARRWCCRTTCSSKAARAKTDPPRGD